MLKVYKSTARGLAETDEVASGCWVHIESPEPAEIERLREFGIPDRLVGHVLDPDERPRSVRDDGVVLIVLHFPIRQDQGARIPYISGPLSIFLTDSLIVTVAPHATGLLQELARDHLRDMSPQNRARWKRNYSSWLEQKQARLAQEEKTESARQRTLKHELEWVRMAPRARQSQEQGPPPGLRAASLRVGRRGPGRNERDLHPARSAARGRRRPGGGSPEGLRRPAPHRQPVLQAAAGRHRRHHRSQRRWQVDDLPHDHPQGEARFRRGEGGPHRAARLRRPVARLAAQRQERLGGDLQRPGHPRHRQVAREEFLLAATAQNLRRMATKWQQLTMIERIPAA